MGNYDIVAGIDGSAISKAISQFHNKSDARSKLFSGRVQGLMGGINYDIFWDIAVPPQIELHSPDQEKWKASIGPDGNQVDQNMFPTGNIFMALLPKTTFQIGDESETTEITNLEIICSAESSNKIVIKPLAIYEGNSNLMENESDAALFNIIVVPSLFKLLSDNLKGLPLPEMPSSVFGVNIEMSDIVTAISDKFLIMGSSEKGKTTDLSNIKLPTQKSMFILVNPEFVLKSIRPKIEETLNEIKQSDNGNQSGLKWSYSVAVDKLVSMETDASNATKVKCALGVSFSGDISTLGGLCATEAALK